jgi:two-component system response regulator PhoP
MRVLIVEDEVRLAKNIAQLLREREHFAVDLSHDGIDGLHLLTTNPYDLAILDWMMPGMDGLELLQKARQKDVSTPVLFLTARDSPKDVITGLNSGCDDYLTKPFDMGELVARCKALLRRSFGHAVPIIQLGRLQIDTAGHAVQYDSRPIELTAMEYQMLEYLALKPGHIISKEELLEHLYDFNWERFSNVIEVYISNLRKKLDPEKKFAPIKTIRGQGYMLQGDK